MKLTNVHKHFGLMLLLGILAWAFAYFGKAHGQRLTHVMSLGLRNETTK